MGQEQQPEEKRVQTSKTPLAIVSMKSQESRRIMPLSVIVTVAVCLLILLELAIMGGVLQLRSATVAKYAPWAYEPFLKLVGEHPDSQPVLKKSPDNTADAGKLDILSETNRVHQKPIIIEPTIPEDKRSNPQKKLEPAPVG